MSDPRTAHRFTKNMLVAVSHAIEQAALAAAEDGPMVVLALFQRLPYFERERQVYERIAQQSAAVVVALAGAQDPVLPAGVHPVLLDEREPLAREWTVAVLTPRFGAVLVARDQEQVDPAAETLESGRLFDGWWRFRRDDALHEVLRLRAELADRLPPEARAAVDDVVQRARELPPAPGESRADAAVRLLVERAGRDRARILDLRRRSGPSRTAEGQDGSGQSAEGRDGSAGLTSSEGVGRWLGAGGVTASGTLPVALLGVRVSAAEPLPEQAGRRSAALRNEGLIGVLNGLLRDVDRATRVDENEFLLILPAMTHDDAVEVAYRFGADLAAASTHNPFLSATASVVVAVTRRRPLPVSEVRDGLRWATEQGVPVATLNDLG